jgi:NTP pyrophosphatase (non-canonical NTP hydrolase)
MKPFSNQLSPAEAERLAMLAEECGEVIQAIGKILRHGYESTHPDGGPTNRENLNRELNDLTAVIFLMTERGTRDIEHPAYIPELVEKKLRYAHHQGSR